MKNARVFLLEIDEGIMKMAIAAMKPEGHQVVLTAGSFTEAKTKIEAAKEKANVAVIDSYLGETKEGQEVAELLKAANPEIKIVAFGWFGWDRRPQWCDAWVDKATNPGGLGKAITNL